MNRGAVKTKQAELVALWVPKEMLAIIDIAVRNEDSDRSKFIRRAIRNQVDLLGLPLRQKP